MRLLLVTRHPPTPGWDGTADYLLDLLLRARASEWEVHIAWTAPHESICWASPWAVPEIFAKLGALHLPGAIRIADRAVFPRVHLLPRAARMKHHLKTLLGPIAPRNRQPVSAERSLGNSEKCEPFRGDWASVASPGEIRWVAELGARLQPDAALCAYPWMTPCLEVFTGRVPTACLDPDVSHHRMPDIYTAAREAQELALVDTVFAISAEDAAELAKLVTGKPVFPVPKPVRKNFPGRTGRSSELIFVGSENAMNIEGLAWFLDRVWPLLLKEVPDAKIRICGNVCKAFVNRSLQGVRFLGRRPDLGDDYRACGIAIVPLLNGTGIKIKFIEAASWSAACVVTPVALQGLGFLSEGVRCTADPSEFAAELITLIRDPAARDALGARLEHLAETHLSADACYQPWDTWLSGLRREVV